MTSTKRITVIGAACVLALTACSSSDSPAESPSTSTNSTTATSTAAERTLDLTVDGVERTALVYVPESATAGAPALLALHGSNNSAASTDEMTLLRDTADEQGFVLVFPQGSIPSDEDGKWSWNVPGVTDAPDGTPEELPYLRAVIDEVVAADGVDPDRVFATGYSGGGRMISDVACTAPGTFAAIAPVVGLRAGVPTEVDGVWQPDESTCDPATGTPVITFTGEQDPINPAEGGGAAYWQYGAQSAVDRWLAIDGCTDDPTSTEPADGVTRSQWTCAEGVSVVEFTVADGGHTWFGGNAEQLSSEGAVKVLGAYSDAISANDEMWAFFSSVS